MSKTGNTAVEIFEFNYDNPVAGLKLVNRPVPEPGAGEVLVNVILRPIHPVDVYSCNGVYPAFTKKLPAVPGFDGEACSINPVTETKSHRIVSFCSYKVALSRT